MKRPIKSYDQKKPKALALTPASYSGLQDAYDHFNRELFDSKLPDLLMTFARKARSRGYFGPQRFAGRKGDEFRHDELALNPDHFVDRTDEDIVSVLVHEQAHVWQFHFGKFSGRYHNKQWGAKMKELGLYPSNTGEPGGKETGTHMSHYIIVGGPYQQSFKRLAATGWKLDVQSTLRPVDPKKPPAPNSKTKFSCAQCGQNAWGKPDSLMICTTCFCLTFDDFIAKQPAPKRRSLSKLRDTLISQSSMQSEKGGSDVG